MSKTELFVRQQAGGMMTVANESVTTGNIWWVDSGSSTGADAAGYGQNPDAPFLTLDYAIGNCTANQGDIIYVMSGHAETLTAAGGVTVDVAGITIIGLGEGADRPTFTFSSTDNTASILITGASTKIKNIIGVCGDDGLTNPFHVQAADCELDIEWHDGSSAIEAVSCIVGTDAADRLNIKLKYIGFTAGDACVSPILLDGSVQARINVDFYGKASTAVVRFNDTAVEDVVIEGYFYNESAALTKNVVDTPGTSTWWVSGYDGKSGQSFSGGNNAAVAGDDVSGVASQCTSIATGAVSLGTQITAVASQSTSIATGAVSLGTQITAVASQSTSIATGTVSVGAQVLSGATSIGIGTSVINSQAISIATGTVSVGAQVLSGATSIGIGTSVINSQALSIATAVELIYSMVASHVA